MDNLERNLWFFNNATEHNTTPQTVIAGLTRNLLGRRDSFLRGRWRMFLRHDGKGSRFELPSLLSHDYK